MGNSQSNTVWWLTRQTFIRCSYCAELQSETAGVTTNMFQNTQAIKRESFVRSLYPRDKLL